jgi:hypothetical protein
MADYKNTLEKLNTNLNTLRQRQARLAREAKHADNVPLDLLNQITEELGDNE